MKRYLTKVKEVIHTTPTVALIRLQFQDGQDFIRKPGQYVSVFVPKDNGVIVKPYSVTNPPSKKSYVELCIKKVEGGYVSTHMHNLKPGQEMMIFGPVGRFTLQETIQNDIIFLATGTGISAIKPMIDTIFEKDTDKQIWLFFGVRNEDEIIYKKEFEELAKKHKNFHFIPVLSEPNTKEWKGEIGYVQQPFQKYFPKPKDEDIYICGVLAMVREVHDLCRQMGFNEEKIHLEEYI